MAFSVQDFALYRVELPAASDGRDVGGRPTYRGRLRMIANDDVRVLSQCEMEAVVGGHGPPVSGDPTADD